MYDILDKCVHATSVSNKRGLKCVLACGVVCANPQRKCHHFL